MYDKSACHSDFWYNLGRPKYEKSLWFKSSQQTRTGTAQQFFKQSKFPGLTTKFNFVDRGGKKFINVPVPFFSNF